MREFAMERGSLASILTAVLVMGLASLAPRPAGAASVASDDASNYSGFGTFGASNLGTGFGAWTIGGSDNTSANEGAYLNTASKAINVSTKTWGFYGKNGQVIEGKRAFTGSLSAGQVFQLDLQSDGVATGTGHGTPPGASSADQFGFELRSGTTARFRFYFVGGQSNCRYDDSTSANDTAAGGFPSGGFRVVFRLLTTDTYEFAVISGINGSVAYASGTRTLGGTSGTGIDGVDLYVNNAGSDCYFNSMKIGYGAPSISTQPAATTTVCQNSAAAFSVAASSTDGSTPAYAWRRRGSGWGTSWVLHANSGSIFLASSAEIDSSSNAKAWGLQQTSVGTPTEAIRSLPATLAANQTLALDLDNKNVTSGGSVGISLQDASGSNAFEFYFSGGGSAYSINDNSSGSRSTGLPFTSTGLSLRFTLTSSTAYSLTITRLSDKATFTLTGSVISSRSIQRVRLFCNGAGGGNNVYFNNLVVAGADDNAGNYGSWSGDGGQMPLTDGATGSGSSYSGSATASFSILDAQTADGSKSYDCAVMAGQGYTTLSTASALTVNANPTFTTSQINNSACGGAAGSITVSAAGGSGTYTYSKDNGATFQAGNQFTGLASGGYSIVVMDSNGCLSGATAVTITDPTGPSLGLTQAATTCHGGSDGQVTATFSGGTEPYQVKIDAGSYSTQSSPFTFTGLAAGSHMVTVTDANGCTQGQTIAVTQPTAITFTTSQVNETCNGDTTGSITVTPAGGSGAGYTYSKDNGTTFQAGATFSGLAAGGYQLMVKDGAGCVSAPAAVTISEPTAVILIAPALPDLVQNIAIDAVSNSASGGIPPYTYSTSGSLPTGLALNPATGVLAGNPTATGSYTFTEIATDASNCTGSATFSVSVGAPPSFSTQPQNASACDGSGATFTATATGDGTLAYAWRKLNTGWGYAWEVTGNNFLSSSTDNDEGGGTCASFGNSDINSSSGNAWGMYGPATAIRGFPALTAGQVFRLDMDNGSVDTGVKNGFRLQQTAGPVDIFRFYFLGGQSNYKYADSAGEHDTGIGFTRTGLRIEFHLGTSSAYTLVVTPCGGTARQFFGTLSAGTIERVLLECNNAGGTCGGCDNLYFNNLLAGNNDDNAGFYSNALGSAGNTDHGSQLAAGASATTASYTTPALSYPADSGGMYQLLVFSPYGVKFSSLVTATVNPLPTAVVSGGGAVRDGCSQEIQAALTGTGPWTVTWSDSVTQNGVGSSPATRNVYAAGTYTVTALSDANCSATAGGLTGSATVTIVANAAPVFSGALSFTTASNAPATIALGKLMNLASDPDSDGLGLSGVDSASQHGGTVVQNGSTSITYAPASNYGGVDSFTYWVGDGCKQATNTVNVTVGSGASVSLNVVYGPLITNGTFVVHFAGIPGYTYTIESSDTLDTPSWAKKTNLTAPTDNSLGFGIGIFEFSEAVPEGATERFYRTVYPSY